MAQAKMSERQRRAKARLSDMLTQEVSLVDAAANLRKFVIVKRDPAGDTMRIKKTEGTDGAAQSAPPQGDAQGQAPAPAAPPAPAPAAPAAPATPATPDAEPTAKALALPSAAKQGLLDGLAASLEKLTALATVVGEAEINEEAPVPPELAQQLSDTATMLADMATAIAPAPTSPADASAPPDPNAPPPDPNAPPPDAAKALDADVAAMKGLVEKVGRKMAGSRLAALKNAWSIITSLLQEVDESALNDAPGAGPPPADVGLGKSLDPNAQVLAKLEEIASTMKLQSARIGATEQRLSQVAKASGLPNAKPQENGAPPDAKKFVWPHDLSADIAERRRNSGR